MYGAAIFGAQKARLSTSSTRLTSIAGIVQKKPA